MKHLSLGGVSRMVHSCRRGKMANRLGTLIGRGMPSLLAAVVSGSVFAAEVPVSDSAFLQVTETGVMSVSAPFVSTFPASAGTPSFWFDCSETNGWTFAADGVSVTRIPSKVGSRFLTATPTTGWKNWNNKALVAPTYHVVDDRLGRPSLDFGAIGSCRGLVFDPDENGETALKNIGTVIAVYDSREGGGWLLGGGTSVKLYSWHRGRDLRTSTLANSAYTMKADSPLFDSYASAFVNGTAWHDGLPTWSREVGYPGRWEVLAVNPTEVNQQATGVGIGDARDGMSGRSGGMRIAELIIFDKILPDTARQDVEAYLSLKWFGPDASRGISGRGDVGLLYQHGNVSPWPLANWQNYLDVSVASDERLGVDRLAGGRGVQASLTKTGAGTLAIGTSKGYGAAVTLAEGTLEFPRRAVPDALPEGAYLHFDASDETSVTLDAEDETVVRWTELTGAKYFQQDLYATTAGDSTAARPKRLANALGDGLHVLDFGPYGSLGAALDICTNNNRRVLLTGCSTVVAVIGAQEGGGSLIGARNVGGGWNENSSLTRADVEPSRQTLKTGVLRGYAVGTPAFVPSTDAVFYLDGVRSDPAKGFLTPGYQVMAVATHNGNISMIGGSAANKLGGFRLAELVVWQRPLGERELRDAQAYLAKKWLKRDMPGYERAAGTVQPDLQKLTVADGTAVCVSGEGTARVASLVAEGTLVKKGAGTLEVVADGVSRVKALDVQGGDVKVVNAADVETVCEPAKEPCLHLDATDAASLGIYAENGTNFVRRWADRAGSALVAYNLSNANSPWLNDDEDARLNGKPVIDFGPARGPRHLHFSSALDGVRSVFLVYGSQNGGGDLLGSSFAPYEGSNSAIYDFLRAEQKIDGVTYATGNFFYYNYNSYIVETLLTNGVKTANTPPTGDYQLIELHPTTSAHVSALGCTRWGSFTGGDYHTAGQRYGEILLYSRVLTERERIATRNYLMKKWFGKADDELAPLPAVAEKPFELGRLTAYEPATLALDGDMTLRRLAGSAPVEKRGAGVLEITDNASFTGTVQVSEGALRLSSTYVAPGEPPTEGCVLHLDATRGVTAVTNGTRVSVTSWANALGDGVTAEPWTSARYPDVKPATLIVDDEMNGLPVVNMEAQQTLRLKKDGAFHAISNAVSVFWAIGSQNGGGNILAGVGPGGERFYFHRGADVVSGTGFGSNDTISNPNCAILFPYGGYVGSPNHCAVYLNGELVNQNTTPLSGRYDVLSLVLKQVSYKAIVEGLASDARYYTGENSYLNRCGHQRLGELIIYDRVLSEEERAATERYLMRKWGMGRFSSQVPSEVGMGVALASGTTLDCAGGTQNVASLSGAGTTTNGTIAVGAFDAGVDAAPAAFAAAGGFTFLDGATWTVDFAAGACDRLDVAGTLTFEGALTLVLRGVTSLDQVKDREFTLATADTVAGAENLAKRLTLDGPDFLETVSARVRVKDGAVTLRVSNAGTLLIFR